jgi:hypothetical protein
MSCGKLARSVDLLPKQCDVTQGWLLLSQLPEQMLQVDLTHGVTGPMPQSFTNVHVIPQRGACWHGKMLFPECVWVKDECTPYFNVEFVSLALLTHWVLLQQKRHPTIDSRDLQFGRRVCFFPFQLVCWQEYLHVLASLLAVSGKSGTLAFLWTW